MKEIIHLSIGQCGNKIGHDYFKILFNNCRIDPDGNYCGEDEEALINVYFNEIDKQKKYKPRRLLIDLQSDTLNEMINNSYLNSYTSENQIYSTNGTQNNWAQGYYKQSTQIIDQIQDKLKKETEQCSSLQGFQFTHSLSGGTGSGLSCLTIQKIKDYYADSIITSYPVLSSEITDLPYKLYNEILSLNQLTENVDISSFFDNLTLQQIQAQLFKINKSNFDEINNQVSKAIIGITCPLIFPSENNQNLRELCQNLLPFPRLNFLLPSQAPLIPRNYQQFRYITIPEIMQQLYGHKNVFCEVDIRHGKYLCGAIHFQGYISQEQKQDIDNFIKFTANRNSSYFVEQISQSLRYSICSKSIPISVKNSATFIGNNTAITQLLDQKVNQFKQYFNKRYYLQYYQSEGLDELEFVEAEINLINLIQEYLHYQNIQDEYDLDEEIQDQQINL